MILSGDHLRGAVSIALFEDRIYWTNPSHGVNSANKFTGRDVQEELSEIPSIASLIIMHPMLQNKDIKGTLSIRSYWLIVGFFFRFLGMYYSLDLLVCIKNNDCVSKMWLSMVIHGWGDTREILENLATTNSNDSTVVLFLENLQIQTVFTSYLDPDIIHVYVWKSSFRWIWCLYLCR